MKKIRLTHAVKWSLTEYECGNCETGVVQVHNQCVRGTLTSTISGCLDCGHEYGIRQARDLKLYTRDDKTWA